jgi:hypothetical protein
MHTTLEDETVLTFTPATHLVSILTTLTLIIGPNTSNVTYKNVMHIEGTMKRSKNLPTSEEHCTY